MSADGVRAEIHKRLTLNWLIQGAAQHAGMTFQHLVRDQLDALDPQLLGLYDHYALSNQLQRWRPAAIAAYGSPTEFWLRARTNPEHPFYGHPLLVPHGGALAEAARERASERSREKGLTTDPQAFMASVAAVRSRILTLERPHAVELVALARRAASDIWGIPADRLHATLGEPVPFGTSIRIRSPDASRFAARMAGLGGVERRDGELAVVAFGRNWHLLTKELVKGTAELICMHGTAALTEDDYRAVAEAADRIEHERWMLMGGGELWRRLLAVAPADAPMATLLMHIARLPPQPLHGLVGAVIERPDLAREILTTLAAHADGDAGQDAG